MNTKDIYAREKISGTAESIVFANQKGGTGKTTSCLSIAGYLAKSGNKVLVVDFDPQANATSGLGIDILTLHHSMYDVVLGFCDGYEGVPITQVILETNVKNLHVAPSDPDLSVAEVMLQRTRNKAGILRRILEEVKHAYDYILIDVPPSFGFLMINGIYASNHIVVPIDPSIFSLESLDILMKSFNDIERQNENFINQLTVILIRYVKPGLFSMISGKRNPSKEVKESLLELYSKMYIVPESLDIYNAQDEGFPISHSAPRSKVGRAYEEIARNIIVNSNHELNLNEHK